MTKKKRESRRAIRARARKRRQQQRTALMVIAGVGLLLVAASWYMLSDRASIQVGVDYDPEDIVSDRPLHAIHEMEPPSLDAISFLPSDGPQPKIAVSETSYDFGLIGAKDVVQRDFVIANIGDAPLTISRAYTTCGCTTADFTATVIPPGKVSVMTVTFDAGFHENSAGQVVRRGVMVENNDPDNPQMEIWIEASVRPNP